MSEKLKSRDGERSPAAFPRRQNRFSIYEGFYRSENATGVETILFPLSFSFCLFRSHVFALFKREVLHARITRVYVRSRRFDVGRTDSSLSRNGEAPSRRSGPPRLIPSDFSAVFRRIRLVSSAALHKAALFGRNVYLLLAALQIELLQKLSPHARRIPRASFPSIAPPTATVVVFE